MGRAVFLLSGVILLVSVAPNAARSGFLLTLPRVLQVGSTEKACLSLHETEPYVDFTVTLESLSTESDEVYYTLDKTNFHTANNGCFDLEVPSTLPGTEVKLRIVGTTLDDYSFEDEVSVAVAAQAFLTFIQTDKPIYKPGQTVRFRILTVKPDLRPLVQNVAGVWVKDASGTRVIQWHDVEGQQGMVSLELPLSEEPVLGAWTIEANISGTIEAQTFKVDEYVLPKYEVTVNPPPYVLVNTEAIEAEVCAMYTYGQPVRGNLSVTVCVSQSYYSSRRRPCAIVQQPIHGCTRFTVDPAEVMLASHFWSLYNAKVTFKANVTERATGLVQNGAGDSMVERNVLEVELAAHSPNYYKPPLPYHGKGSITRPDGSPAPGELVTLEYRHYTNGQRHEQRHNYTTDESGFFSYSLPAMNSNASITVRAILPNYTFPHMPSIYTPYIPGASIYLKPWYSPSGSFLQIEPIEGIQTCGAEITINVVYTTPLETNYKFYYMVMSRGNIVWSGHKHHHFRRHDYDVEEDFTEDEYLYETEEYMGHYDEEPEEEVEEVVMVTYDEHTSVMHINLPITADMAPHAQLLIYYVRPNGETVADSYMIIVDKCVNNSVELSLGDGESSMLPGSNVDLLLRAAPDSLCSVGVVDQSVNLLGGQKQLSLEKVFSLLAEFDLTEQRETFFIDQYCRDQVASDLPTMGWDVPEPRRRNRRTFVAPGGGSYSRFYDSSKAFRLAGQLILTDLVIDTRPCHTSAWPGRSSDFVWSGDIPDGAMASPVMNMVTMDSMSGAPVPRKTKTIVDLRTYFPETWLWELHNVGESGELHLHPKVPHTLTTWKGRAFCSQAEAGMGVSSTASLTVFQPFFLSLNLPYSVIDGENVPLSVTVFNYLEECLVVMLTLKQAEWFDLDDEPRITKLCVCGGDSVTHKFQVTTTQIGTNNVTIKAESVSDSNICGDELAMSSEIGARDAITRSLIVEPEGTPDEYSIGSFVCLQDSGTHTDTLSLELPSNLVADSERGYFTVIGDVMGPSLSGLDKLLAMPTGCGEQNMLKFAPNIYVMQYLTNTEQMQPEITSKALSYLHTGYQRELTYRHEDGSYSAFGASDESGSTWLTAFVLKSFVQAQQFISIDSNDLEASEMWLTASQQENGCFPRIGRVLHKAMKGGLSSGGESAATLTAYVLAALLEAGTATESLVVEDALRCLSSHRMAVNEDAYTLALMGYAYALYDPHGAQYASVMDRLDMLAVRDSDSMMHWTANPSSDAETVGSSSHHQAGSADVELTSYVLLCHLISGSSDAVSRGLPIVKWLTQQRNGNGGFASTQDTIVALHALSHYAALVYGGDIHTEVSVTGAGIQETFTVTNDNSLLQFRVPIEVPNTLAVMATGEGCIFMQANVKYNVANDSDGQTESFFLRVNTGRVTGADSNCQQRTMSICTRYLGSDAASNMAVVAVKMVSGWIPIKNSVKKLVNVDDLDLKRYEIDGNWIHFYFDELTERYKCLEFIVEQNQEVGNAKPGFVQVYDYYQKDLFKQTPYTIRPVCGTKEELPDLTPEEYEEAEASTDPAMMGQRRVPLGPSPFGNNQIMLDDLGNAELTVAQCPTCLSERPDNLQQLFCESLQAYKIDLRIGRRLPFKVLSDLRPSGGKVRHQLFTNYAIPDGCPCETLTSDVSKILVLTKESTLINTGDGSWQIPLEADVTILPMADIRQIERDLRRTLRESVCDEI